MLVCKWGRAGGLLLAYTAFSAVQHLTKHRIPLPADTKSYKQEPVHPPIFSVTRLLPLLVQCKRCLSGYTVLFRKVISTEPAIHKQPCRTDCSPGQQCCDIVSLWLPPSVLLHSLCMSQPIYWFFPFCPKNITRVLRLRIKHLCLLYHLVSLKIDS